MKMNVAIISPQLGLGGTQRKIVDIIKALARKNKVANVYLFLETRNRFNFLEYLPKKKTRVIIKEETFMKSSRIPFILFILWQLLINPVDAILSFYDYCSVPTLLSQRLIFWRKFKIILGEDALTSRYTRYYTDSVHLWLIKHLYPLANQIICSSTAITKELNHFFDIPKSKLMFIPNWTSFKNSKKERKRIYDCIFAGRFEHQKNLGYLVDVFDLIVKQDPGIKLHLFGEGDQKKELINKVEKLELKENVKFHKSNHQIKAVLEQSRLMVLSSRYEGMPLIALECMALGVPVVSKKFPGVEDFIFDGENGYIVKSKEQFAEKILECLSNKKLYNYLSRNAQWIVKREFSVTRAEEYCDFLLD